MLKQLQQLRTLLLALLVMARAGNGWGQTTATIEFNTNGTQINAASVTGDDSQGNTWTITTVGTTSFTENPDYSHVGSSKYPAKSITFTTTLANDVNITSFSAKFGGFGGTAGTVTLKVGDTPVGTGSLNGTSDVTVNSTSSATGKVLTVTVTGISKGVKAYYISYTYEPAAALEKTDPTITFNEGSVRVGRTLDLSTLFRSNSTGDVTYSISEGDTYASLSDSFLKGEAPGTVTVKAEQAETTTYNAGEATATITVNAAPTLSSIAVTTPPTKTTYSEGETFNPEGMVVTATYIDNSTDDVTSFCTFTPSDALTTSINEITVSYTEGGTTKTATQSITVNPYVPPTEIPLNNTGFGTSYNGSVSGITDDDPITNTINNLTVTYAGSGNHYLNNTQIRLYPNNKLTFKAPSGYEITNIVLIPVSNGNWTATISSNPGSYDTSIKTWTGSASLVEFSGSGSGRCDIASATITLAVQKTLQLSSSNVNPRYGTNATVNATVPSGYEGTLTAESSNDLIATASVESTTITITPVAVGTATITVTAPATNTFSETATEINVTVEAPEGKTTAALFNETFDNSTGTAGWSGSSANGALVFDNKGWVSDKGYGNDGSAKFGTSSAQGYAITPALGEAGDLTLSFKAAAWNGDKTDGGLILSIEEGEGTLGTSTFTLVDSQWSSYETTITGATAATKIKFSAAQSSKNRFFLDDVVVTKPGVALTAKFNTSGYATYCSEYPLYFSTAEDYSAWQVTGVDGNAITFEKVTGSVKGGTGLLLMGEPGATVTLTSKDSETVLTNNKLEGTLAPTYVEANKYYGLSGQHFLKVNPGTVPAGKALLPVVDNVGNVRTLSLVFVDPTTGIAETKTMTNEDTIYNLQGQRISKVQRGINIVGGKKVLVK